MTDAVDDGLGDLSRADGPWSLTDAPVERAFIDFGPLRLPALGGIKARAEYDATTRRLGAVSVRVGDGQVQLQVLAAPRGRGIWSDVRRNVVAQHREQAGHQHSIEGTFGPELFATVTGHDREGRLRDVTIRYVGIDGDRWMLRAIVTGPSVATDEHIDRVDAFLSQCAVERGEQAAPAGSVLELTAPPGAPRPESA